MCRVLLGVLSCLGVLWTSAAARNVAYEQADAWSKSVKGLEGCLRVVRAEKVNGTPILVTYLELRNASSDNRVMEIPLDGPGVSYQFAVKDGTGKPLHASGGPFDEIRADIGVIRLPNDSTLRVNMAHREAGIPKDYAAHLDLGAMAHWDIPVGNAKEFYLSGRFSVKSDDKQHWSGTLALPAVRLPLHTMIEVKTTKK